MGKRSDSHPGRAPQVPPTGDIALVFGKNQDGVHILRRRDEHAPIEAGLLQPLVPLRIGICVGLVSSTIAFLGVLYAIVGKWLDREAVPGWASSVAISSFLFAVLFVFLAILAEYVGRIMVEALAADGDLAALRARAESLCARRPLYPGFRGYPTYLADGDKR